MSLIWVLAALLVVLVLAIAIDGQDTGQIRLRLAIPAVIVFLALAFLIGATE